MPGFLYGTNRGEAPLKTNSKAPRLRTGDEDFPASSWWMTRSDRLSHPGAFAFDGKISAVFGTHTHVPTADLRILPGGTGYVSDLGMCGESGGILGMEAAGVVKKMRSHLPDRFVPATGEVQADGVIFDIDEASGHTRSLGRISF